MAQVERLPSKIVQYDGNNDCALCEDGSLWCHNYREKIWWQLHPPHQPPTHAADLAEALEVLRNLVDFQFLCYGIDDVGCRDPFRAAEAVLRKHGV